MDYLLASSSIPLVTNIGPEGEKFLDCVKRTVEISHAHGKSVGMFMDDLDVAKKWSDSGMNIYWTAPENVAFKMGLRAFTDGIAAL